MTDRGKIAGILEQVRSWRAEEREELAKELLADNPPTQLAPAPRDTLSRAIGIARGDGPAPTDDQVRQIIDDHRMERYGK